MSWWMLPPADTGKVTEQYTSQPPPSLRPAASQPVCRNTAIINPASPSLSLSPPHIHAILHSHASQPDLSSVCPMNLLRWFAHLCIYRPFSVTRSLFPVIPWEAYPTFISFFSFLQPYFLNCVVSLYFLLNWPTEGVKWFIHSNYYNFKKIFCPLFGHTSPKSHSRIHPFIHKRRSNRHRPCSCGIGVAAHPLMWLCVSVDVLNRVLTISDHHTASRNTVHRHQDSTLPCC